MAIRSCVQPLDQIGFWDLKALMQISGCDSPKLGPSDFDSNLNWPNREVYLLVLCFQAKFVSCPKKIEKRKAEVELINSAFELSLNLL